MAQNEAERGGTCRRGSLAPAYVVLLCVPGVPPVSMARVARAAALVPPPMRPSPTPCLPCAPARPRLPFRWRRRATGARRSRGAWRRRRGTGSCRRGTAPTSAAAASAYGGASAGSCTDWNIGTSRPPPCSIPVHSTTHTATRTHRRHRQKTHRPLLQEFRDGTTKILIATDVLARGFDVTQVRQRLSLFPLLAPCLPPPTSRHVSHQLRRNVPVERDLRTPAFETYLHRIGRSGRFGRKGAAFNLVTGETVRSFRVLLLGCRPCAVLGCATLCCPWVDRAAAM